MSLKNKKYVSSVVRNSKEVERVIENSEAITEQTFLERVILNKTTQKNIQTNPDNYHFYKNTEDFEGDDIYFALWKNNLMIYQ